MPELIVVRRKIAVCILLILVFFVTSGSGGMVSSNDDAIKYISDPMGIEMPKQWKIKGGVSSSIIMQSGHFAIYYSATAPFANFIKSVPKDVKIEPIKSFHDGYNQMNLEAVSWDISDNNWTGYRLTKETIPHDLVLEILSKKSMEGWKICCMTYGIDKELDYEIQEVYEWWLNSQRNAIGKEVFNEDQSAVEGYTLILTHAPHFSLWRDQDEWMFYGHGYQGKLKTPTTEHKDVIQAFIAENRRKIPKSKEEDPVDPFSHTISDNRKAIYTVEFLEQILADADKWKRMKSQQSEVSTPFARPSLTP